MDETRGHFAIPDKKPLYLVLFVWALALILHSIFSFDSKYGFSRSLQFAIGAFVVLLGLVDFLETRRLERSLARLFNVQIAKPDGPRAGSFRVTSFVGVTMATVALVLASSTDFAWAPFLIAVLVFSFMMVFSPLHEHVQRRQAAVWEAIGRQSLEIDDGADARRQINSLRLKYFRRKQRRLT